MVDEAPFRSASFGKKGAWRDTQAATQKLPYAMQARDVNCRRVYDERGFWSTEPAPAPSPRPEKTEVTRDPSNLWLLSSGIRESDRPRGQLPDWRLDWCDSWSDELFSWPMVP